MDILSGILTIWCNARHNRIFFDLMDNWDGKKKGEYKHGTYGWLAGLNKSFPKEQKKAVIGCGMIILGGLFQVSGALVTIVR